MSYSTIECQFNDVLIQILTHRNTLGQWLIYLFFHICFTHRESEDISILRNSSVLFASESIHCEASVSLNWTQTNKVSHIRSAATLMASTFFLLEPLVFLCLSIDSIMKMVGEWHFSYKMISNFECLLRETCAIDVNGKLILITCVNAVTLPVALHSETQCLSSLTQRVSRNI